MKINANEIKVGMLLEYKSDLWEVLKTQHVKPGKGGAFNQVEMKNLSSGTKLNERFRSSENVEKAMIEELKFSYLYEDQSGLVFMDLSSFEQISVGKKIIGDKSLLLSENLEVTIKFHNEKPIFIELPKHIDCEIISTDAAIKGQTVSSSYKPAILNNKLKVQVPPFINSGDKITIDTRTLEYIKKV
jgi:elongation factor P|tara:strand:+ start:663 stop:1223 length:561 start_codon:yes stop_codon:yes gene_type:complete